jgi:hypothetical protein
MAIIEIEYEELAAHAGHTLTVETDGELTLYCNTCHQVVVTADLPTYRATVRLVGTAYVSRQAASEDDMRDLVESMCFPGDEDDMEIEVDDVDIEED